MNHRHAVALALALALVPAAAAAQSWVEISPFGGGTLFFGDGPRRFALERTPGDPIIVEGARLEDSWTAGLGVGLRLDDRFGVEAMLAWVPTWLEGSNPTDVYAFMYGVTGVYHLPAVGPLRAYWGVGVGAETHDYSGSIHSSTQLTTSFVGGAGWDLGDGRGIRVQARNFLAPFESGLPGVEGGWENDLMISAGMTWQIPLGGKKAARSIPRRGGGLFLP